MASKFKFQAKTKEDKEEIKKSIEEKKDKTNTKDIENFFEGFIKKNRVIATKTFGDDFTVSLTPCTVQQLVKAELLVRGNNPGIPNDTMARLRACAILSHAIIQLGDLKVHREEESEDESLTRLLALYQQLLSLPPVLIQEIYAFYIDTVEQQEKLYTNPEQLKESIENF